MDKIVRGTFHVDTKVMPLAAVELAWDEAAYTNASCADHEFDNRPARLPPRQLLASVRVSAKDSGAQCKLLILM
jgi:hypothetical protein